MPTSQQIAAVVVTGSLIGKPPRRRRSLRFVECLRSNSPTASASFVSLDCADPVQLAEFYLQLLGGNILWHEEPSIGVQVPGVLLIPQRVANYRPPVWPGASIVHLDLTAGDQFDKPEQRAVALGARVADPQPDPRWRVLLDPAGHPFCITTFAPPPVARSLSPA